MPIGDGFGFVFLWLTRSVWSGWDAVRSFWQKERAWPTAWGHALAILGEDSGNLKARAAHSDKKKEPGTRHASRLSLVAETVGFEPTCLSLDKTISSRSRYDHFDTSPSFAYSLYQNPRERSRHLSRFWGENPCLGLLAVLPDSRDWRYNGTR